MASPDNDDSFLSTMHDDIPPNDYLKDHPSENPTLPGEKLRNMAARLPQFDMKPGARLATGLVSAGLAGAVVFSCVNSIDAERILNNAQYIDSLKISVKLDGKWVPVSNRSWEEYINEIKPRLVRIKDASRARENPQSQTIEARIAGFGTECELSTKASALLRVLDNAPEQQVKNDEAALTVMASACDWNEKQISEKRAQYILPTSKPSAVTWTPIKKKAARAAASTPATAASEAPKVASPSASTPVASEAPASAASGPASAASASPTARVLGPGVTEQLAGKVSNVRYT